MTCSFTKRQIVSSISKFVSRLFDSLSLIGFNRSQNFDAWTLANQGGLRSKGDFIIDFQNMVSKIA